MTPRYAGSLAMALALSLPARADALLLHVKDGGAPRRLTFGRPVPFDMYGIGQPVSVTWPSADFAFLVLDRNADGRIDDGAELFGDATPLIGNANRTAEHGFFALIQYDDNRDGVIDAKDLVYRELALWHDANANAIVDKGELTSLSKAGVKSLGLTFRKQQGVSDDGQIGRAHV